MKTLVAVLILACGTLAAEVPGLVAIRNAKVYTVSGPVLPRGTVVIRNGLIEAVGENVNIPAGAWVVEGEGLTVYPGLIDGMGTWGIERPVSTTGGRGGTATTTPGVPQFAQPAPQTQQPAQPRSWGPEDRPRTTSWLRAADEVKASDRRLETARSMGITASATFPTSGIFAGQGAIVATAGDRNTELVIASPIGQYITMGGGGRGGGGGSGFPGALFGIISYVRQIYLDAEHYKAVKDAYAKNPRGMTRPAYDRALEGVMESPRILLPANSIREIDRMVRFAQELKQPAVLYGLDEGYAGTQYLKQGAYPVLVSLRWPEAGAGGGGGFGGGGRGGGGSEPSLRSLESWDRSPSTPSELLKAGIKFAFYTDGIENSRDLTRAVKRAMESGLKFEDALRAFTLSPAEIWGVGDRLGSIENGKIANLVVTKGDLFQDRTTIEFVMVDGVKYSPPAAAPGAPAQQTTTPNQEEEK